MTTREERRATIDKALTRVRKARGGVTGYRHGTARRGYGGSGFTGGTQIVYDPSTGKSAVVKETPENLAAIEAGKRVTLRQRASRGRGRIQPTSRQEFQAHLLKKQGYTVSIDKTGAVIAKKGNRQTVINRAGGHVIAPVSAKITPANITIVMAKRRKLLKEQKDKKDFISMAEYPFGKDKQKTSVSELKSRQKKTSVSELKSRQKLSDLPLEFQKRIQRTTTLRQVLEDRTREGSENIGRYVNVISNIVTDRQSFLKFVSNIIGGKGLKGIKTSESKSVIGRFVKGGVTTLIAWPFYLIREIPSATAEMMAVTESFIRKSTRRSAINRIIPSAIRTAKDTFTAPEFYGGLIAGVAIAGIGGALLKPTKPTLNKISAGLNAKIRTTKNPVSRANLNRALRSVEKLKRDSGFVNKLDSSVAKAKQAAKPKGKVVNPQVRLASELIRQIEVNKVAINLAKAVKAKLSAKLNKTKLTPKQKKVVLKQATNKIRRLEQGTMTRNAELLKTKISPSKRAVLRLRVKRRLKQEAKIPKAQAKAQAKAKIKKPDTTIKVVLKLDKRITAAIRKANQRFIKTPTRKIIRDFNKEFAKMDQLSNPIGKHLRGYRIRRLSEAKAVKVLTRTAKLTLAKIKGTIEVTRILTREIVTRLNSTLKRFGYKVSLKVRAKTRAAIVTGVIGLRKGARIVKQKVSVPVKQLKKSFSKVVSKVVIGKKVVKVFLNRQTYRLERGFTVLLSRINKVSPVKLNIQLITKDGTIYSWFRGRRTIGKSTRIKGTKGTKRAIRTGKRRAQRRVTESQLTMALEKQFKIGAKTPKRLRARFRKIVRKQLKDFEKSKLTTSEIINRVRTDIRNRKGLGRAKAIEGAKKLSAVFERMRKSKIDKKMDFPTSTGTGRVLIQKQIIKEVKAIKKDIGAIKTAKTKTSAKNKFNSATSKTRATQQTVLKLVKKGKGSTKVRSFVKSITKINAGLFIAAGAALTARGIRPPRTRQGIIPITKPEQPLKQSRIQKREIVQKPIEEEKLIIIPDTRLDTKTSQQQIKIITTILTSLALAQAFRLRGKVIPKAQTRLRGGIGKTAKFIFNKLKKKRRAFTPDVFSLVFGIRAKPRERIQLLRRGRVFTGLERRAIVR